MTEDAIKFYERFVGKVVRVHTVHNDTIEGIWIDHLVTYKKDGDEVLVWWIQIQNVVQKKKRSYYILAEIDVIEVLEVEEDP